MHPNGVRCRYGQPILRDPTGIAHFERERDLGHGPNHAPLSPYHSVVRVGVPVVLDVRDRICGRYRLASVCDDVDARYVPGTTGIPQILERRSVVGPGVERAASHR